MKVFQVLNGLCHWDATSLHPTLESTAGVYSSDIKFVEAPDTVFEGWGYNEETGEFSKPLLPEGWSYDEETGIYYHMDENGNLIPVPVEEPETTTSEETTMEE